MNLIKRLAKTFRGNGENRYAIQMIVKAGVATYLPVVKESELGAKWIPIVKVYDRYIPLEIEKEGGLSEEECVQHIEEYKKQIAYEKEQAELSITYKEVM